MSTENFEKIAAREITMRRRGRVQLAGLSFAILVVLTAMITAM